MLLDETRRAVLAAPRENLSRISGVIWTYYARGSLAEEEVQELSELIHARKQVLTIIPKRRAAPRLRSPERLERRRRWVASGRLPPALAARFTLGETAALAVVALEVSRKGDCRLTMDAIASVAGVCRRIVQGAIRQAQRLGLMTIEERRMSAFRSDTNILRVVSLEWMTWIMRGGCRNMHSSNTRYKKGDLLGGTGKSPLTQRRDTTLIRMPSSKLTAQSPGSSRYVI